MCLSDLQHWCDDMVRFVKESNNMKSYTADIELNNYSTENNYKTLAAK